MNRVVSTALVGAFLVAGLAGSAAAGDNRQAAIALHIAPANFLPSNVACDPPGLTAPTLNVQNPNLSVPVDGPFYWTYLLVCNGSDSTGIAGMEMGIDYDGQYNPNGDAGPIVVFEWRLCGDLQFPFGNWPAPNSSNLVTWTFANCNLDQSEPGVPRTVIAVGGYFYMGAYAPSQMSVIPRPVSGRAKVASCASAEDDITFAVPSHLGIAGFGGMSGYNPCGAPTPVQSKTWGAIKNLGR